jgi:hypothetical protein
MGHLRNIWRSVTPNPFTQKLKKQNSHAKILLFWNRGLGDIPLELYPLIRTIYKYCPKAEISVITRKDLIEGFYLLDFPLKIYESPLLIRKQQERYDLILEGLGFIQDDFDLIFNRPDPAYWIKKEKKHFAPKLSWKSSFYKSYPIDTAKPLALLHIHSETVYGFEKNLPSTTWEFVIEDLKSKGYFTIAIGHSPQIKTACDLDLRGKTSLFEFLSLMLNRKCLFIGPDSGLLNILYFLDIQEPWLLVSFWANPRVGLLNYPATTSNKRLTHKYHLAPLENLSLLSKDTLLESVSPPRENRLYINTGSFTPIEELKDQIEKGVSDLKALSFYEPKNFEGISNPDVTFIKEPFEIDSRIRPIILAGGQGTRLGASFPKALFEINGTSLIGHFCLKIKEASLQLNQKLQAFMIVSPDGFEPIKKHLEEKKFFDLDSDQLIVLIQDELPLVTLDDELVLKNKESLYLGPNGNGEIFHLLDKNRFFESRDDSILGFEIIPIDNPLAPLFFKDHVTNFLNAYDVSILATASNQKNLGKIAQTKNGICIIEYTENPQDTLQYANTGLLGFSYEFAKKCSRLKLPIHTALKNYSCFTGTDYEMVKVKKHETFIFDLLSYANKIGVQVAESSKIFQPLKEKEGLYGIKACQQAIEALASNKFLN